MDQAKLELWKKRLQDYQESGVSGAAWCKKHGIPEHQFWYWKKKESDKQKAESPIWVPVSVEETKSSTSALALTIRIGSAQIEVRPGYDAQLLQDVVRTLMKGC